jgi:hypothetical protein
MRILDSSYAMAMERSQGHPSEGRGSFIENDALFKLGNFVLLT